MNELRHNSSCILHQFLSEESDHKVELDLLQTDQISIIVLLDHLDQFDWISFIC